MSKYINKSVVIAEIKKLRDRAHELYGCPQIDTAYNNVLSILDTLETKDVDLEKEIKQHINNCLDIKFPTTDIKLIAVDVEYTARKFFELGLKAAQKGEQVMTQIEFEWKPITEIPTEHWDRNDAISPKYLVKCGEEDGKSILGYSNYSFVTNRWIDVYRATSVGVYKVTAWTDIKL